MRRTPPPLILLTLATMLWGCSDETPPPEEILRPVRSQTVIATGGGRLRTFSGTARAGQETDLSFRVAGKIERLAVAVGDAVRAGAMIARLEQTDQRIAVRRAEANLVQAQAAARNAAADLERIRSLYESDDVSRNELDAAMATDESARAQTDAAAQTLEGTRRQLSYTRLLAPVDGSIASVPVEVNENVSQGQTVARVTSGSQPEVGVAIPEVLIAQIREGNAVTVSFDALGASESFDAVVTEVGVSSTGTTTTFPVTVRLISPSQDVRSGMAANVTFRFVATDSRVHLCVPPQAVGEDRQGRFVFVLEALRLPPSGGTDAEERVGIVRRTAVEVAPDLLPEGLEILSGLSEGQRVVTAGVRRLTDGQQVRLLGAMDIDPPGDAAEDGPHVAPKERQQDEGRP